MPPIENEGGKERQSISEPCGENAAKPRAFNKEDKATSEQRPQKPTDRIRIGQECKCRCEGENSDRPPLFFRRRSIEDDQEKRQKRRVKSDFKYKTTVFEKPWCQQRRQTHDVRDLFPSRYSPRQKPEQRSSDDAERRTQHTRHQNARTEHTEERCQQIDVDGILVLTECAEVERPAFTVFITSR